MDDRLRASYTALAARLDAPITALRPSLTRVACHGVNNFMSHEPDGTCVASFFDFDETGLTRWRRYMAGFRSVRQVLKAMEYWETFATPQ